MFRKRLAWFSVLLGLVAVAIIARLAQIQVADAADYERLATRILTNKPTYVPAPRGAICDRYGTPLLADEPTSELCVHYGVLSGRSEYLAALARALRSRGDFPASMSVQEILDNALRPGILTTWKRIAEITGLPPAELNARVEQIRQRIERWRERSQQPVREEQQLLPLITDLPPETALALRLELEHAPWLRVLPGARRIARDADTLSHLLGRLGEASPERIATDPYRDDERRRLRPGDRCGVSGVERLADASLRGAAGKVIADISGTELERIPPEQGRNVHLTIDLALQQYVYELLAAAVEDPNATTDRAGAAAVVLDAATREVLALVSYPSYAYGRFNADYDQLRQDVVRQPLLFRAVQARYAPGSICKAITLVGGLTDQVITPETRFHCTGHLLPERKDRFRCWIYNQEGTTHDAIDDPAGQYAEIAVKNSCNIYFFQVGQRLTAPRLCEWFTRFGLGQTQSSGLIEEAPANVPTSEWLRRTQNRDFEPADAWNLSIGQGEITTTPLQAANVAATIATGYWQPVRLAYDDSGRALGGPPAPVQPLDEGPLRVLRRGLWLVVNDPRGTGRTARLNARGYEMCGKTGSAQAVPLVLDTIYTLQWPDGRREDVTAQSEEEVLAPYADREERPKVVGRRANQRFPDLEQNERLPSHAWFMGYTQPSATKRGAAPRGEGVYAIAVIVEFGGSGGRVSGPIAKKIADFLLADPQ